MLPFDRTPDHVNEEGTKWWKQDHLTTYAQGRGLDAKGYVVETIGGGKSYVVVMDGRIIADSPSLETVGVKIDVVAYLQTQGS